MDADELGMEGGGAASKKKGRREMEGRRCTSGNGKINLCTE
jgi:hypothetical protein